MKNLVFQECRNEEDILNVLLNSLKNDVLVKDEEAAKAWFKEAGIDGEVVTHVLVSTHVSVWDEEHQGSATYSVIVSEHFIDAGSEDYVYSYKII